MSIVELCEKYSLELTKQGSLFVTFCPFHRDENRPNFTIYPETDSYFCYTCSKGGDVVDLFARMENIPRATAEYRLYSDLQVLRDKINKIHEESPYNDSINLQLSKQIREYLYRNPSRLSSVLTLMQAIDNRLQRDIDQEGAVSLIEEVNTRLKLLSESV